MGRIPSSGSAGTVWTTIAGRKQPLEHFRTMSLRHDRRRRLVTDESPDSESEGTEASVRIASGTLEGARAYSAAADPERQLRLADAFPHRLPTIALSVLGAATFVGVLVALDVLLAGEAAVDAAHDLVALTLSGVRNTSHWFASMLLATSAVLAMVIY